jgi:hypothetical protein
MGFEPLTEIPSKFTGIRNGHSTNPFYFISNKGAATKSDETPCVKSAEAYLHASGIRTLSPEGLPCSSTGIRCKTKLLEILPLRVMRQFCERPDSNRLVQVIPHAFASPSGPPRWALPSGTDIQSVIASIRSTQRRASVPSDATLASKSNTASLKPPTCSTSLLSTVWLVGYG